MENQHQTFLPSKRPLQKKKKKGGGPNLGAKAPTNRRKIQAVGEEEHEV